jgi:hypothetical protein
MTLPDMGASVDTTALPFIVSANGNSPTSVADLVGNDQATVVAAYKAKYITNGTSVFSNPTGVLSQVFGGLAGIPGLVFSMVAKILAPFGALATDFSSIPDALKQLVDTLDSPLQFISNLAQKVEGDFSDMAARIAALEAKSNTLNPVTDNCTNTTNLVPVVGTVSPTGWGAWTAAATAAAIYNTSPGTDRQGAGIAVKAKRPGQTRVHICSNTAMTNWAALELNPTSNGADTVAVVTGTGPTTGVVSRTSLQMRIPDNTFWEIRYEPYDDTSPTSNTFHVFLNGAEIVPLRWNDAGNSVIHDGTATYQHVGVTLNGLNDASHRGFSITEFTFYDWLTAAPQ